MIVLKRSILFYYRLDPRQYYRLRSVNV